MIYITLLSPVRLLPLRALRVQNPNVESNMSLVTFKANFLSNILRRIALVVKIHKCVLMGAVQRLIRLLLALYMLILLSFFCGRRQP